MFNNRPCATPTAPAVTSAVYVSNAINQSNLSAYTFSAQPIGVADSNRYVVLCLFAPMGVGGVRTLTSVTVGGVSASVVLSLTASGTEKMYTGLLTALVPTGTTADVVVTWSGTVDSTSIGVYRLIHADGVPFDTFSISHATAAENTVPFSGHVVGIGTGSNGNVGGTGLVNTYGTVTPTENYENADDGGEYNTAGAIFTDAGRLTFANPSGNVCHNVTATWD